MITLTYIAKKRQNVDSQQIFYFLADTFDGIEISNNHSAGEFSLSERNFEGTGCYYQINTAPNLGLQAERPSHS